MMSSANTTQDRIFMGLSLALGVLLSALVVYRGITLSITYDEVYTYLLGSSPVSDIMFANKYFYTANNHVLNSLLIKPCLQLFGHHEWVLRLPSMLSFGLFYGCSILLIRMVSQHLLIRLLGIVLIGMNMYLFDFFSLSRGYGLANAFEAASLVCMLRYIEHRNAWFSFFSYLAAALAVMANFTWLNFFLPLWLSMNVYFVFIKKERLLFPLLKYNIIPLIIGALLAALCYLPIHYLSKSNEFRWGANAWFDSFHTFTIKYIYSPSFWVTVLFQGIIMFICCYAVYIVYNQKKNDSKIETPLSFVLLLITSIITATIAQRLLLGIMYMDGRKSTMYILLVGLVILSVLSYAYVTYGRKIQYLTILLLGLLSWNIIYKFNPHLVTEWSYDAYTKEALSFFKPITPTKPKRICASWEFISGLNYYNQYFLHNALTIIDMNDTANHTNIDGYYVRYDQQYQVPKSYKLVNVFPNSHLVYQRKPAH